MPLSLRERVEQARVKRLAAERVGRTEMAKIEGLLLCRNLFDAQRELHDAIRYKKARQIVVSCTRRGGKTYSIADILNERCYNVANYRAAYITDTRQHAKDLLMEYLETVNGEAWDRKNVWFSERNGYVRYPSKSRIYLGGFDKAEWIKKLLGKKFDLVVIDEAQDVRGDQYDFALKKVLKPTLADKGGILMLVGTPSPLMEGHPFGYAYLHDTAFKKFSWTQLDNPFMEVWAGRPDWKEYRHLWLEEERQCLGYAEDDPEWQREYLGVWTPNRSAFILHVSHENLIPAPRGPKEVGRTRVLGVDVGFNDDAAFVVLEYWPGGVRMVIEEGSKGMNLGAIIEKIEEMRRFFSVDYTVIDPSSGGKAMVNELTARYGKTYAKSAQRHQKDAAFRLMATALRRKELFLIDGSVVHQQAARVIWDKQHKRESTTCKVDYLDACLYAFRECYFYYSEIQKELAIEPRTQEWFDAIAAKVYDRQHDKGESATDLDVQEDAGWL